MLGYTGTGSSRREVSPNPAGDEARGALLGLFGLVYFSVSGTGLGGSADFGAKPRPKYRGNFLGPEQCSALACSTDLFTTVQFFGGFRLCLTDLCNFVPQRGPYDADSGADGRCSPTQFGVAAAYSQPAPMQAIFPEIEPF